LQPVLIQVSGNQSGQEAALAGEVIIGCLTLFNEVNL
jgi:hypothetical protein